MRIALILLALPLLAACEPPVEPRQDPLQLAGTALPQDGCTVPTLAGGESGVGFEGIPAAQAALLGRWVNGMWDDTRACHAMTVEHISPDGSVVATFATGASSVSPPTARRVTGTVDESGRLELTLPDGSQAIYALDGTTLRGAHIANGVMRPVALNRG